MPAALSVYSRKVDFMALKAHAVFWKLITVSSIFANGHKQGPDGFFYQEPAVIYWHVRLYSLQLP